MACMTLFVQPMAMATTQLARVIGYEVSAPWPEQNIGRQPLRMNWVVVTGRNGNRKLRMQWTPSADNCCRTDGVHKL
jgi:hypothetical protein